MDFTYQRNDDLMAVFRRIATNKNIIAASDIFRHVANSPAKRFWVSPERAAIVVSMLLNNKPLPAMRPNKKEMFMEIFRRFLKLRESCPNASVTEIVSEVILQPAPKFYLTPRTTAEIIYKIKKGWYDRQHNRYRNCSTHKL